MLSAIASGNRDFAEKDASSFLIYVGLIMSSVTTIVNVISYVLIAFVAVSLIVSSIMIGGLISSKKAAKKDPVTALRTE